MARVKRFRFSTRECDEIRSGATLRVTTAPNVILPSRTDTPSGLPQLIKGSQPTDGGNLLLSQEEQRALVASEPHAKKWIRRYIGAEEFLDDFPTVTIEQAQAALEQMKQMLHDGLICTRHPKGSRTDV